MRDIDPILIGILIILGSICGLVVAALTYQWWSPEIPVAEGLTATLEWSGNPIVGETITITLSITNPSGSDISGTLVVEIYENDQTTLDTELFNSAITVLTTGYSDSYIWTANLGSHYAKATFIT